MYNALLNEVGNQVFHSNSKRSLNTILNTSSNTSSSGVFGKTSSALGPRLLRRAGAGLVLSAMAVLPGVAMAETSKANYSLSYSSSELESVAAVEALHVRIRRAALAYCPDYAVTKNLRERANCINDVESDLVSQVNNPLLTKVHTGQATMTIAGATR